MDKVIFSSLTSDDICQLVSLSSYLLSIKAEKEVSPLSGEDYFISSEPVAFSVEDLALLKKLKHLHIFSYD